MTDGSHSSADWNAKPPSDPLRYGIILAASSDADRRAVSVADEIYSNASGGGDWTDPAAWRGG